MKRNQTKLFNFLLFLRDGVAKEEIGTYNLLTEILISLQTHESEGHEGQLN